MSAAGCTIYEIIIVHYRDITGYSCKCELTFYDLFQNFSTKGKEFAENFLENKSLLDSIEQKWLCLQSYKDCIKFMKFIEAI